MSKTFVALKNFLLKKIIHETTAGIHTACPQLHLVSIATSGVGFA